MLKCSCGKVNHFLKHWWQVMRIEMVYLLMWQGVPLFEALMTINGDLNS